MTLDLDRLTLLLRAHRPAETPHGTKSETPKEL
jgi:hypothetical protein